MSNDIDRSQINKLQSTISQRVMLYRQKTEKGLDFESIMLEAIRQFSEIPLGQAQQYREQIHKAVMSSQSHILAYRREGRAKCRERVEGWERERKINEIVACVQTIVTTTGEQVGNTVPLKSDTLKMIVSIYEAIENREEITMSDEQLSIILMDCYESLAMYKTVDLLLARGEQLKEQDDTRTFAATDEALTRQQELAVAVALNLQLTGKLPDELAEMDLQTLSDAVCISHEIGNICDAAARGHFDDESFEMIFSLVFILIFSLPFAILSLEVSPLCAVLSFMLALASVVGIAVSTIQTLLPAGILETKAGVIVKDYALACKRCARELALLCGNAISGIAIKLYNAIVGLVHPSEADQAVVAQTEPLVQTSSN